MSEQSAETAALDKIDRLFNDTFTPDFTGYDWRDDATIQQFARTLAAILRRRTPAPPALGAPQNPVDGATHACPAPGYAGRHTAVGAGAISPPYVCHGCRTWFVLPEEVYEPCVLGADGQCTRWSHGHAIRFSPPESSAS